MFSPHFSPYYPNLTPLFPHCTLGLLPPSKFHSDFIFRTVLSHYDSTDALEDLLSQLYRSYGITPPYGTSPQVPDFLCSPKGVPYTSEAQLPAEKFEFKIPEMPSSPRAKMLQNFQRRLMFPGYFLPHNGENFQ